MTHAIESNRSCVDEPNKSAVDAIKTKPIEPSIKKKLMIAVNQPGE